RAGLPGEVADQGLGGADGAVILEEQAFLQADVDLLDAVIGGHAVLALVELLDAAAEEAVFEGLDLDQLEALRHALDKVADLGLALTPWILMRVLTVAPGRTVS